MLEADGQAISDGRLRIGVVGNCVAGKSTLVDALKALGYAAVNIPQEHSVSKRFWRRLKPDFLICLRCTLATARQRRQIQWGQERLNEQWNMLSEAKENSHLILDTDELSKEDVLRLAVRAIEEYVGSSR